MILTGSAEFTPVMSENLFLLDENGRDLMVIVVKRTYQITSKGLAFAEEQMPINLSGEYCGEPGESSLRYEPEIAPRKIATDVVLIGHAYAPHRNQTQADVTLRVGSVVKTVRVFGDRFWSKRLGMEIISPPQPFEKIPLIYERAFGGWDRSNSDPERHGYEPRNPVGSGYRQPKHGKFIEGRPLPNLEEPRKLISDSKDCPLPAGFGFIGPEWEPRRRYGGTYDKNWAATKMPLLPNDFNPRYYNAAHPDLVMPGYLHGNEAIEIINASPKGTLRFNLPRDTSPDIRVDLQGDVKIVPTALDTVIINCDAERVLLLWRASLDVHGKVDHIREVTLLDSRANRMTVAK